jgi:hypothetical protein
MSDYRGFGATIPSDIERADRLLGPLTARQLAILVPVAVALWAVYAATRDVLPPLVFAVLALPVIGTAAAVALAGRDGLSLDRLLLAAARQARQPRRLVIAPEGVAPPPSQAGVSRSVQQPAPLRLPVNAIRKDGAIDLGSHGVAALVACSTVSFALRTIEEQAALVAAFGQWLNSVTGPTQILIRAQRVNLAPAIGVLRDQAGALPHPALERAALDHAGFLAELAASRDLLIRQVLVVVREPHAAPSTNVPITRAAGSRATRNTRRHGDISRKVDGAALRALRRGEHTARALAGTGISAHLLDGAQAAAVLVAATDPTAPPMEAGLASPGEVITGPREVTGR